MHKLLTCASKSEDINYYMEAVLLLEDNTIFRGKALGKIGTTTGELCFNTGMTGYQEIYTDPSYFGQIVINTTSHIGNYGTIDEDNESNSVKINGMVCNYFSPIYSRTTADSSLQDYLENANLVGISDIDTRALVKHIRHKGAMNAVISSENTDLDFLKAKLAETPSMDGLELASKVTTAEPYFVGSEGARFRVAVLDLGIKTNILNNFHERDCYSKVFPATASFEEMQAFQPHGYFISNGPGDPASMPYAAETVKKILATNTPVFGICLGHQVLALAMGVKTYKMHNGHRGLNHPVKNLITGKSEITSQNHGFGVDRKSLESNKDIIVTHVNLNDDTVEGIKIKGKKAFSVQYHPESSPGPHDSRYLFDEFIRLMAD